MEMRMWIKNSLLVLGLLMLTAGNCDAAKKAPPKDVAKQTQKKAVKKAPSKKEASVKAVSFSENAKNAISKVADKATKDALNVVLSAMLAQKDLAVRVAVSDIAKCWSPTSKTKAIEKKQTKKVAPKKRVKSVEKKAVSKNVEKKEIKAEKKAK